MSIISDRRRVGQRARHAFRDPSRGAHLLGATVRSEQPDGHRIVLAVAGPVVPVAPLPGPADLSLTDRSPVIAVATPGGFRIVERWWDVLPRLMRSMFDDTLRRLVRIHDRAARLARQFDARQELLERYLQLKDWAALPSPLKVAGQLHRRALTDPQLGPDAVRCVILQHALAGAL